MLCQSNIASCDLKPQKSDSLYESKIDSLNELCVAFKTPTLENYAAFMQTFKPITTIPLLFKMVVETRGPGYQVAHLCTLLEVHGLYWTASKFVLETLVPIMRDCFMKATDFVEFLWNTVRNSESQGPACNETIEQHSLESLRAESIEISEDGLISRAKTWLIEQGVDAPTVEKLGGFGPVLAAVAAGIAILWLGPKALTTLPSVLSLRPVVDSIKGYWGLKRDIVTMWKDIMEFLGPILGFTYTDSISKAHADVTTKISQLHDRVKALTNEITMNFSTLNRDGSFFQKYFEEVKDLEKVVRMLPELRNGSAYPHCQALMDVKRDIQEHESRYLNLMASAYGKQKPVIIYLAGVPGVGKSQYARWIVTRLSQLEGRILSLHMYSANDQYWSGYAGQDVVWFDEFGSTARQEDHLAFQSVTEDASSHLNMAAVEQKGMLFSSRYIIVCTNGPVNLTHSEASKCPAALNRRKDFGIHCARRVALTEQSKPIEEFLGEINFTEYSGFLEPIWTIPRLTFDWRELPRRAYELQERRAAEFRHMCEEVRTSLVPHTITVNPANARPIILLLGAPGTGKTTIAQRYRKEDIQDEIFFKHKGAYSALRQKLHVEYDSPSSPQIWTSNNTAYWDFLAAFNEEERTAIERRFDVYSFSYRTYQYVRRYDHIHAAQIADGKYTFEQVVCVKTSRDQVLSQLELCAIIQRHCAFKPADYLCVAEVPLLKVSPEVVVTMPYTWQEIRSMSLPSLLLALPQMTFKGTSYFSFQKMMEPVISGMKNCPIDSATPLEAMLLINSQRVKVEVPLAALINMANFQFYVLTDEDQRIVLALVDDTVTYNFTDDVLIKTVGSEVEVITHPKVVGFYNSLLKPKVTRSLPMRSYAAEIDTFISFAFLFAQSALACYAIKKECEPFTTIEGEAYCLDIIKLKEKEVKKETPPDYMTGGTSQQKEKVLTKPSNWEHTRPDTSYVQRDLDYITAVRNTGATVWSDEPTSQVQPESSIDENSRRVASMAIEQNFPIMKGEKRLAFGQMIHGRVGVTVGHLHLEGCCLLVKDQYYPITSIAVERYRDAQIFRVDEKCQQFKDLRCHLQTKQDPTALNGYQAQWLMWSDVGKGSERVYRIKDVVLSSTLERHVEGQGPRLTTQYLSPTVAVLKNYELPISLDSHPGDCGSPIVVLNSSVVRKIVGIHMAGSTIAGYCNLIYKEDFPEQLVQEGLEPKGLSVLEWSGVVPPDFHEGKPDLTDYRGPYPVLGRIGTYIGDQKVLWKRNIPNGTKMYKSPFQGFLPNQHEPAVLHYRDPRLEKPISPYYEGMAKWDHPQPKVDLKLLSEVTDCVASYIVHSIQQPQPIGMWTKEEAINGSGHMLSANKMERNTSPGFPETEHPTMKGKKKAEYFDFNQAHGTYKISDRPAGQYLRHILDDYWNRCKRGEKALVVFSGCLKDEVLPLRKIEGGKTRTFTPSPTFYTIAHRRAFGAAAALLIQNFHYLPFKVGINAQSMQWDELATYMLEKGVDGFDADYKNYDATIPKVFMQALPKIWNRIYKEFDPKWCPEDDLIRETIHKALHGPYMLFGDFVVRAPGGHVSGQPATALDNCIVNFMYYAYIWTKLARQYDPKKATFSSFIEHVRVAVYGDDNICTILPEVQSWFNFDTFSAECGTLGLTITPADKISQGTMKKLWEMTFLKRNFNRTVFPGRYVGQLNMESMAKMLNWTQRSSQHVFRRDEPVSYDEGTIHQVVVSIITEAALHGKKFYWEVVNHLKMVYKTTFNRQKFCVWVPEHWETFDRVYMGSTLSNVQEHGIFKTVDEYIEKSCPLCQSKSCDHILTEAMADSTGNNPPMPQSGGATGAVFTGTDTNPIPLSNIAATPAPTLAEASPHAGVINVIDPYFYNQFVGLTNFTWTTSQQPGTLLWSSEITPLKAHINLQYLSKLYNIWVGGLDYQVKIAGTGFHAGALAVVRLPPNIDPQSLTGTNQFTMFEYVIIDPKTLEAMMKGICDQRPIMYHYMSAPLTEPNAIGGHIAIYVMMQLNTSSSGSNQIDVQVFNKAAIDFNLLQIVPINLPNDVPAPAVQFRELFQSKALHYSPYVGVPITSFNVNSSAMLTNDNTAALTNINSGLLVDGDYVALPIIGGQGAAMYWKCTDASATATKFIVTDIDGNPRPIKQWLGNSVSANTVFTWYKPPSSWSGFIDRLNLSGEFTMSGGNSAIMAPVTLNTVYPVSLDAGTWTRPSGTVPIAPPVAESICTFQAQSRDVLGSTWASTFYNALTTLFLAEAFKTRRYQVSAGQAVLLSLIDTEFNTPLLYLKLYANGYFTAPLRTTALSLDFSKLAVQFVGYIRELDPIPGPTIAMESMLAMREQQQVAREMKASLDEMNKLLIISVPEASK